MTQQEVLNQFFKVLANSKLFSELDELTSAPTLSHYVSVQSGSQDALRISIPLLRGKLGSYNAATQSPNLTNGNGVEGDSYLVSVGGTVDFGNGNRILDKDDVIEYTSGQWRNLGKTPVLDLLTSYDTLKALSANQGRVLKEYVDSLVQGLKWKDMVDVATTATIVLSGEQTIDGVLTSSSRVLVKNQASAVENGIYTTGAGAWVRTADADLGEELINATVSVNSGTENANTNWTCNSQSIVIGTDTINWVNFANISSGVQSVTGPLVDNTDPRNPVIGEYSLTAGKIGTALGFTPANDAATVKSVSVNGGTAQPPDEVGNVDLTVAGGTDFTTDESLYLDPETNILRANVSNYSEAFMFSTSQSFTLAFEPTNFLGIYVQGVKLVASQYTFTAPDQLTINDTLDSGDMIEVQYEHFITI